MVKIGKEKENKKTKQNKNKQTNIKGKVEKGIQIIQEEDNVMIIVKKKFKNSWSAGKLKNR